MKSEHGNVVHGHTSGGQFSPEYTVWASMLTRCLNPKSHHYRYYGGRGITVCDKWRHSFQNFLADMGPRPSLDYQLERVNGDLGYCPENCKWATRLEQSSNKSNNVFIEHDGIRLNVHMWSKRLGIKPRTIYTRLEKGRVGSEALSLVHLNRPNRKILRTRSTDPLIDEFVRALGELAPCDVLEVKR